jgi:hypothetical protein
MSGPAVPQESANDDPPRDPHLLAALRHAPDRDASPPPALSARILAQARQASSTVSPPLRPARTAGWLPSLWAWLAQPVAAGALGTVLIAGFIGLMWHGQPVPDAVTRPPVPELAPAPVAAPTPDPEPDPGPAPAPATATAPGPAPTSPPPAEEAAKNTTATDAAERAAPRAERPTRRAPSAEPQQRKAHSATPPAIPPAAPPAEVKDAAPAPQVPEIATRPSVAPPPAPSAAVTPDAPAATPPPAPSPRQSAAGLVGRSAPARPSAFPAPDRGAARATGSAGPAPAATAGNAAETAASPPGPDPLQSALAGLQSPEDARWRTVLQDLRRETAGRWQVLERAPDSVGRAVNNAAGQFLGRLWQVGPQTAWQDPDGRLWHTVGAPAGR